MNPKPSDANSNNQNGTVTIEGGYATLQYKRRLSHPPEVVWKAITDPKELAVRFNTKATIDARPGGIIEFISAPADSTRQDAFSPGTHHVFSSMNGT
jgi:uncharacterized protein YndB with AHSA1/START domain